MVVVIDEDSVLCVVGRLGVCLVGPELSCVVEVDGL